MMQLNMKFDLYLNLRSNPKLMALEEPVHFRYFVLKPTLICTAKIV